MTAVTIALILSQIAAPPPATAPADAATEIQQVVDRAFKQYETASSYEDKLIESWESEAGSPLNLPEPSESSLAFVRPGKLALETPLYRVIADGEKLWEVVDVWMQYSEAAAPKALKLKDISLSRFGFFRDGKHPLLALIVDADRSSLDVLGHKTQLTAIRSEPLEGAPGKRVTGTTGPGKNVAVEIWFDDATGLIGEIVHDHTKSAQVSAPAMKIRKIVQRMRFKNVRLSQPIAADRFACKPDSRIDKVAELQMPSAQQIQQRLVGKPAPVFTGKDLAGKSAGPEDFKGRILVLDFWSLGCGPCIMSMPTLQRVSDKYLDKPVSIIGVNLDGPLASAKVVDMLNKQKVKFRNLIETKPALAEKYFVEGIPCTVLIDGKGIVQSVHMGMADERDLSSKIEKLLKGENLFVRK